MKKLLLGLILLTLLVVISYVQYSRYAEREAEGFIKGHTVGLQKAKLSQPDFDSLQYLLQAAQSQLETLESEKLAVGAEQEAIRAAVVDSLSGRINLLESEIGRLKKRLAAAETSASKSATKTASTGKAAHTDILNHYRLAVSRLPSDLSDYEHRVAIAEIRVETAEKFSITVDRLNQIREKYNLDY